MKFKIFYEIFVFWLSSYSNIDIKKYDISIIALIY